MTHVRKMLIALIPLLFLATVFWKPTLFDHKSLIHGDSIVDGLSLFDLQARALHHLGRLLWSDQIYGGHPLFAEGQGAFANPLNMLFAWVAAPIFGTIYVTNLFHWVCMVLTGIGVIGLCRSSGVNLWASGFAAIAVVFSPVWIGAQQNLTISGALVWVPWAFWAMETWLKRPTPVSGALLGLALAMIILAGYPQAFHGTVLYLFITLLVIPFQAEARRAWIESWRTRLGTAAIAAAVGAGLSAVQWLPLLELTQLSVRNGGTAIVYHVPIRGYFRGILFTLSGVREYFPSIGSLLVCVAGSLALLVKTPARIKGHMLAIFFLIQLGFENSSPLFRFVRGHDLVPGLQYFRTVHLYLNIAIVGIALLAACGIDGIVRWAASKTSTNRSMVWKLPALIAFWSAAAIILDGPSVRAMNLAAAATAIGGGAALIGLRRAKLIPVLMTALLIGECMNLRLHTFQFQDASLIAKPASASAVEATGDWRDYKILDDTFSGAYGFTDSHAPGEIGQMQRMLASLSANSNLLWDLSSMNGALALPLARRTAIDPLLDDEIHGRTAAPPGSRLIDFLDIRYVSLDGPVSTASFDTLRYDEGKLLWLMENKAARPRFQIFNRHVSVATPEEALAEIKNLHEPVLVIENPAARQIEMLDAGETASDNDASARFDVLEARSTAYHLKLAAARPVWLFLADANYPGWRATLDGKPAPLFSAQILGKAIGIPAGDHDLTIAFTSETFRRGFWISLLSLAGTAFVLFGRRLSRVPGRTRAIATG